MNSSNGNPQNDQGHSGKLSAVATNCLSLFENFVAMPLKGLNFSNRGNLALQVLLTYPK